MHHTLASFSSTCHDLLKAEPGPAGREKVCALVQDVLKDETFVAEHLTDTTPERKIIYQDPELGFCILAHVYHNAKTSPPHDHGPSWAIYGQAAGETHMTDYELVAPASAEQPGKAKKLHTYTLKPGMAYLYNEGHLHSPTREGPTRLLRMEGLNMDTIKRFKFDTV